MAALGAGLASFLKQLQLWWHNQLGAMRALDELNRSPHTELLRTAGDFGITVQRLKSVAARGPLSTQLLEKMARAYGLDSEALRRADLNTVREMEERCTFCDSRYRCATDLSEDRGVARARSYCANAEAFAALCSGDGHLEKS